MNKVISASVTPLMNDGSIDKQGVKKLFDRNIKHGLDGAFILGTMGEWGGLSDKIKEEYVETACEATKGTGKFLKEHGIKTRIKKKLSEGSEEILDSLRKGHVSYVINTVSHNKTNNDGFLIRRVAAENNITCFTSLDTVNALLDVLDEITIKVGTI